MSHSKPIPPKHRELLHSEVVRAERVTPHMIRVTLGGGDLARLEPMGFDQWFRLFLPHGDGLSGETNFALPSRSDLIGYAQYLAMPRATRPPMRNYTVREFRAETRELDIDVVDHGDQGVGSAWACRLPVGDHVALLDEGIGYDPAPDAEWQLFVADESGLAAVAGILRDVPRDTVGHAFIEIPDAADAQPLAAPDGVDVHWIVRGSADRPGAVVRETVQAFALPDGPSHSYLVGESALPTSLRRWLISERGAPKSHISFCGYWKLSPSHARVAAA